MSNPEGPRQLGRGMILVGALGALALLTFGFDRLIQQQHNPNQRPATLEASDYVEVALDANHQDHYVANALINGSEVEIMVDTGATQVAVSEALAQRLNLPRGPSYTISTANGNTLAYATRITSLRLGPIEMRDIGAAVVPNMSDPDVLLGMNFLRELELVQREGRLLLRQYR